MTGVFGEIGAARTRDGRTLSYHRSGTAGPMVVFESGLGAGGKSWGLVTPGVAERARTIAYDRAGFGGSDPDPARRDVPRMVEDLAALLDALGEQRYVLAGHSLGGPIIRAYALAHPDRVAGLVLVDQAEEGLDHYYHRGRNALVNAVTLGMVGLARLGITVLHPATARAIRKFPAEQHADLRAEMASLATARAAHAEFRALTVGFRALQANPGTLPDVPVTVISGAAGDSERERKMRVPFVAAHRAQAAAVPQGRHVLAERTGHMVPQDRPDVVVEEILRITDAL